MSIEVYDSKAIISGDVVEFYVYEEEILKGYKDKIGQSGRRKDYVSPDYVENRKKSLRRAEVNLRRIINSNVNQYGDHLTSKFMTLTFEKNVQDMDYANYEFKKFIGRLNYFVFKTKRSNIKYSAVVEFQERGSIHYHVIFYNLPYIPAKKINEIWRRRNGNINIKKIDHIDNVGSYLCKYMSKENEDPRLQGKKCYFNSRGLMKPEEITDKKRVQALLEAIPIIHLKYQANYKTDYQGQVQYYQFNIKYINSAIPSKSWTIKDISVG